MLNRTNGDPAPSRVAILTSVHRWNDTRVLVRQATALAEAGYDVVLGAVGDQERPFQWGRVAVEPMPRRPPAGRWRNWWSLASLVRRHGASIVHVHDPELFPLAILFRLTGRRAICDVHENIAEQVLHKDWIPRPLRSPLSFVLRVLQRALPRLANAVILAEDSYVRDFPNRANVTVIHNFPVLPPSSKQDYASDVLRLVYVGDVRRVRGIDEYVRMVDGLARLGIPVELRVVGSFASAVEQRATEALIASLGLADHVQLLGRRPPEDVPGLLEQADIGLSLLHPIGNYQESYPTKMFEYMAAGLPVIASRFPLWQSVIEGNECGAVVDPLNVDEAVAAAAAYWHSVDLRRRHGRNGRAAVVAKFNWGVEVPVLLEVYGRPGAHTRGDRVISGTGL
jgi:glycosyltransferase involved in cell wall biosynthesis